MMENQKELLNKFLRGEANIVEQRQLSQMANYPASWDEAFSEEWNHAGGELPKVVDERIWRSLKKASSSDRFSWKQLWMVAATVGLFFLGGAATYLKNQLNILSKYSGIVVEVSKGQRSQVTLPDGSQVFLNSGSKLAYGTDFNAEKRTVKFEGEGYFNVAKDANSPFRVETGNITVEALGTSFNISAYKGEPNITTYLKDGKVKIYSAHETVYLSPGEIGRYSVESGRMAKALAESPDYYTAWRDNLLVFDDEPMDEILRMLERCYNVKFIIKNDLVYKRRFGGSLNNNSLQSVLDALSLTSGLRYQFKDNEIILSIK